jgi:hypothetical protein
MDWRKGGKEATSTEYPAKGATQTHGHARKVGKAQVHAISDTSTTS